MKKMGENGIYIEPLGGDFKFSPADLLREVAWSGVTTSCKDGYRQGMAYIMTTSAAISSEWPSTRAIREILVPNSEAVDRLLAASKDGESSRLNLMTKRGMLGGLVNLTSIGQNGESMEFLIRLTVNNFFHSEYAVLVWDDGAACMVPVDWKVES